MEDAHDNSSLRKYCTPCNSIFDTFEIGGVTTLAPKINHSIIVNTFNHYILWILQLYNQDSASTLSVYDVLAKSIERFKSTISYERFIATPRA